jgi:hypothetical protein
VTKSRDPLANCLASSALFDFTWHNVIPKPRMLHWLFDHVLVTMATKMAVATKLTASNVTVCRWCLVLYMIPIYQSQPADSRDLLYLSRET